MKMVYRIAIMVLMLTCVVPAWAQKQVWQDTTLGLDQRVDWIVQHLDTEEKLALMVHNNPAIEHIGLPAYSWWNEALHGVARAGTATVYPMPIALAATFDTALVQRLFRGVVGEAWLKHAQAADTGYRGDYSGLSFFTPNINIFRDPRWGRGMETYGEDPYLTAVMGKACVDGLQGGGAAACLKHLAVHSGPEGVRHEFDSRVDARDLRTTYLPAFEYIIHNTQVSQVMCGYNRINGEPCCTNRELLTDILRHEWNYGGIVVTDCWALNDTYERDTVTPRHRTHASAPLAYGDAFGSEVDLECGSGLPALRRALQYGYIEPEVIDQHVRRLLRVRLQMYDYEQRAPQPVPMVSATDVAAQSMVLLKNNGLLPLGIADQVQLCGPNAADSLMPLGNYNGTPLHTVTLAEAFATHTSADADVVIYCGGLSPQLEGEELQVERDGFYRGDRTRIELPAEQVADIKRLKQSGKRVVLVLCTGSALALDEVMQLVDAVIVAWYAGQDMGEAVRQLVYGLRDDFGRLPITFYTSTSQLPAFESYAMQRRTYRYADLEQVLFPFGYGLSYSYHQLWGTPQFDAEKMVLSGLVSQCATDAPLSGTHRTVVQVYASIEGDPLSPTKQLVGFAPIVTESFDRKVPFSITIDPFWLRVYNPESGQMELPPAGTHVVLQVGFSSDDRYLVDLPFTFQPTR